MIRFCTIIVQLIWISSGIVFGQLVATQVDGYDQKLSSCYGASIPEMVSYSGAHECALKCNSTTICKGFVWEQRRKCIPLSTICDSAAPTTYEIIYVKRAESSLSPFKNGIVSAFLPEINPGLQEAPQIMLSYSWTQKTQIKLIREILKAQGFNVWIDDEKMTGSILDSMADAVEKSKVILVGMSEAYRNSQSCKTEAEYAYRLKKDVIPLMVQSQYTPDGWLGAMIGNKLYFDMTSEEMINKNINGLIKEINNKLSQSPPPRSARTSTEVPLKSAISWSQEDVVNWLLKTGQQNLQPKLMGFNGATLGALQSMLVSTPQLYYETLKRELSVAGLLDLLNFTTALRSLSFN